jgi:hypothetical protein
MGGFLYSFSRISKKGRTIYFLSTTRKTSERGTKKNVVWPFFYVLYYV